jgi:hypothetical protein
MDFVGEGEVLMGGPSSAAGGIPLDFYDQKECRMGIEIKRGDTERLVRKIADATGESVDEIIHRLVVEEARQERPKIGSPEYEARKQAFFAKLGARRKTDDPRPWKQIEDEELYDAHGDPIG